MEETREGMRRICCPYIVKNGKVIYPKNGKLFCFWVPIEPKK